MSSPLPSISPHREPTRTVLWVSDLPDHIIDSDLENFFHEYKDSILLLQINRLRLTESISQRTLTATVIFKDHHKADQARKDLNLKKLRGKTVRIMWHEKDNGLRFNSIGNLFVKGIPLDVKPREVYELFMQCGDIISAKLCEDEDGNHNGYGYVSYYSPESADKAIRELNEKECWGVKLEVVRFQKKNERIQSLTANKNLYVKNLPQEFTDLDLRNIFAKFGKITWAKMMSDSGRKFAIVAFEEENSANLAKETMNNTTLQNETEPLYVDFLQKKADRKKILNTKIYDNNFLLNSQFKNCNLHVRNLPQDVTEEFLHEVFSKYGDIKSLKIPRYILVTKIRNEFKEIPTSKGFGYVCYYEEQNAIKALEDLDGKFLPSYDKWKRPLIIEHFMPKGERRQLLSRFQMNKRTQFPSLLNPFAQGGFGSFPLNLHPTLAKHVKSLSQSAYPQPQPQQQYPQRAGKRYPHHPTHHPPRQEVSLTMQQKKADDPDLKYLNSLEDEATKKDYLGEFLFKKIENHPQTQMKNFTIDTIGKITGMILGIEDLNEIVDITMNPDNLSQRITEALSLLEGQNS